MFSPSSKGASGSESFLWTSPECPVRIHVKLQFLDRLQQEVLELAPAHREVGGLLIGNELSLDGDIEVSDYFQLPAGSDSTKNFVVCSDSLTQSSKSASAAHRRVIGFYRTHLDPRIHLRSDDLRCIRSKFNHPKNVFLVIRPHDGQASAAFFFWKDGSVVGGLTFSFSSTNESRLHGLLARARDMALRMSTGMRIGLFVLLAILVALVGALRIYHPASEISHPLGLRVERALLGIVVAWNPTTPEVAAAKDANLLIWDGSSPPAFLRLTTAQLRSGRTFFTSVSDRVEVRLDIIGTGGRARTESIVSLSPPPTEPSALVPKQEAPAVKRGKDRSAKKRTPAAPEAQEPAPGSFQEAVAIRETRPEIPSELKPLIQSDNVVEVQVRINASGKVSEAKLGAVKGPVAASLSKSALSAARGWQFRPATQNGEAVPSDKVLEFLFRPSNR